MKDEHVQSATVHWGPRFIQNGIDASEFTAITDTLERWEDWCSTWSAAGARHEALARTALAKGHRQTGARHLAQASAYFHFAKFVYVIDLEEMKEAHMNAVRCMNEALPILDPTFRRVEIPYKDSHLVANFRTPKGLDTFPAVILIPGLDSTKEELISTEEIFLDRGLATFTVDGPGQGESEYHFPIEGAWEVPGRAIVDVLLEQPGVDHDRIGVWGVSLGGYYAPRMAAYDERIKACIALAGPYDFSANWQMVPDLTRQAFTVRSHSSTQVEAEVKGRELTLFGSASKITCPLQIVFGERDRLIPPSHARRLAEEASGEVDLVMLEEGNHVCTNVQYLHRLESGDWMAEKLQASS